MTDVGRGRSIPGLQHIEPQIELTPQEIGLFLRANEKAQLQLEDRRIFHFFVQSSRGTIVAAGAIEGS
jgi:hypothetical protein